MMKNSKKKLKKKKKVSIVGGFAILLLIMISSFLYKEFSYKEYFSLESRKEKIENTKVEDARAYAWVRVQGTNIDTPVVPLTSSVENSITADYLWTSFMYVEGENRRVIYGHNIRNVSAYPDIVNKEHFRFEQLVSFSNYEFAKDNLYIQYSNGEEEALYKIYAVTFNNSGDEVGDSYKNKELDEYIKKVKYESIYDYDVDVDNTDELISLITCTRYFGNFEKTQFKVDARRVRKNEKISKYNVETTLNYDIIK